MHGPKELLTSIVASSFDAIISLSLEGTVTSWNPAATKLFGYHPDEMIGRSIRGLIPVDWQDAEDQILGRIKLGEQACSYETVRLHKNGNPIDVRLSVSPIWDPVGKVVGVTKIARDLTAQEKETETLRQSEECLRQFVEQAPAAIAMFDRNMRYMACSRRWLVYHGSIEQSVVGRCHYEVFPKISERWREIHRRGMAGETVRSEEDAFQRADGGSQWVRWEMRPWLTGDGSVGGISIIAEDVTERVEAVRALRESEWQMRLAQEGAKAGSWEWRLADDRVLWSETLWSSFGLEKPEPWEPSFEGWVSYIHPADREGMTTTVKEAAATGQAYEIQWRLNLPVGEPERWLLVRGSPISGANGNPERYVGVVIDITERKQAEEALRKAKEKERQEREELETILAAIPAPVLIAKDASCEDMIGNPAAYELYRLPPGSNISKSAPVGEAPANFEVFQNGSRLLPEELPIRKAAARHIFSREEIELRFVEGDSKYLLGNALPLFNDAGEVRGAVAAFADVSELKHTEAALRQSEQRLRVALEAANAGTWEVIPETGEFIASERALALHGAPPGTPISLENALQVVHPEDLPRVEKIVQKVLVSGEPFRVEFRVPLPDGSIRWVESRGEPRIVSGKWVVSGLLQDITERKRTEEDLRRSEARYRTLIHATSAVTWSCPPSGFHIVPQPEWMAFTGQTAEEMLGDGWTKVVHPDDLAVAGQRWANAIVRGEPFVSEHRIRRHDGAWRWMSVHGAPIRDETGSIVEWIGMNIDITDRKEADVALRQAEALQRIKREELETILAVLPAAVLIAKDPRCLEITGNPAAYELLQRPLGTNLSKSTADDQSPTNFEVFQNGRRLAPEDLPLRKAAAKRTFAGEEIEIRFADGGSKFLLGNALALLDEAGEIRGAVAAHADITDLKRTEAALRESEERLQFALQAANAGTWEVDLTTGRLTVSDRALFFLGFPAGTALTHELALARVHPADQSRLDEALRRTLETGEPFRLEWRAPLADGSIRWLESRGERRYVSGKQVISGLVLDITDRKRSEEEACASSERLEAALSSMADAVFISDPEGHFTHFNEAFVTFQRFRNKDECANRLSDYHALADIYLPSGELVALNDWPVRRALRGETGTSAEYIIRRRDGETYVGSCNFAPIRNRTGEITGAVVTAREITDQKKAENRLRESEERLTSIIDTAADSIIVVDEKGIIQSANRATLNIFGYSSEDIVGHPLSILMMQEIGDRHTRYLKGFSGRGGVKQVEGMRSDSCRWSARPPGRCRCTCRTARSPACCCFVLTARRRWGQLQNRRRDSARPEPTRPCPRRRRERSDSRECSAAGRSRRRATTAALRDDAWPLRRGSRPRRT